MPVPVQDITGNRYDRLLVIGYSHKAENGHRYWRCVCDCGNEKLARAAPMKAGNIRSCGCLSKEVKRGTHYMSGSRVFQCWANMVQRCTNPKVRNAHRYVGRGISVCSEWLLSFESFYRDMGECPPGMSLDRIDNDKGYSKDNCRWATNHQQSINRSTNRIIKCDGISMTMNEWSKCMGMPRHVIFNRLKYGWTTDEAIKTPYKKGRRIGRKYAALDVNVLDLFGGLPDDPDAERADKADPGDDTR